MQKFSIAPNVSYVTLPHVEPPYPSMLDFLDRRFSQVGRETWQERLENGRITDDSGKVITIASNYIVNLRLCYYREVDEEPEIPFKETIVFRNEHIVVACKPHFLPVIPSGPYVNECLLYRLKRNTGLGDLVPVNRLDRETAGLVLFSADKRTRGLYGDLFRLARVRKLYEAYGVIPADPHTTEWHIKSRIVTGSPWFLSKNEDGEPNASTLIKLGEVKKGLGFFLLEPATGKQHQLRLHMTMIGSQILNDFYYPILQPEPKKGFNRPLQLLAKEMSFIDPVTGCDMNFVSERRLDPGIVPGQ